MNKKIYKASKTGDMLTITTQKMEAFEQLYADLGDKVDRRNCKWLHRQDRHEFLRPRSGTSMMRKTKCCLKRSLLGKDDKHTSTNA